MKKKLKKLNIRITELANYLNFSRPTLYKYIEEYNNKNFSKIDKDTKKVFDFIKKRNTISKIQIIDFIINNKKGDDHKDLENLIDFIKKDETLTENLINDIKAIGNKGVVEKIKKIYERNDEKC